MARKLGEILADMVLYGDIEEAAFPEGWTPFRGESSNFISSEEANFRACIAATLLKLTNGGEGGSCSVDDGLVAPYLRHEVGGPFPFYSDITRCKHGTHERVWCDKCDEEHSEDEN